MSKMNKTSIIRDGNIVVEWKQKDVTWQAVLQTARAANSEKGGWSGKSNWADLGLDKLVTSGTSPAVGCDFLEEWTATSLKKSARPRPRPSKFQLKLREADAAARRRGNAKPELEPNDFGILSQPADEENRLNWWLFMALRSRRYAVTYELPLCADADGQLKADLVHFVAGSGLVEIVELKKGTTAGRDSPLMALVEAICYGLQLLRCWSELQPELKQHLKVEPFDLKHLHLILAAPAFGKECNPASSDSPDLSTEQAQKLRAIVKTVGEAISQVENIPQPQLSLSFGNVNEMEWKLEEILPELGRTLPPGSILKPKSA